MNTLNLTPDQLVWFIHTDGVPTQARYQHPTSETAQNPGWPVVASTRTGSIYVIDPAKLHLRPPVKEQQTVYAVVTSDGVPTTGQVIEVTETGIKMRSFKSGKVYDVADADIYFNWNNAQEMFRKRNQPKSSTDSTRGLTIKYDRDWTWLFFDKKPGEIVRTNLKNLGFSWSSKRTGWYAEKHVEIATINAAIDATVVVAQPEANVLVETETYRVTKERDWTWVQFLKLNPVHEAVCNSLTGMGARCSKRRDGAWYFKQPVELDKLQAVLA